MERLVRNVPVLISGLLLLLCTSQVLAYDFDGDNRDDLALYNPSTAIFDIRSSQTGKHQTAQVGTKGNVPCPLDFNGDGKDDPATYNRTTGVFSIKVNGQLETRSFGLPGDIPVNGRYRKTACDDLAVYRPSDGSWWVLRCDGDGSIRYTAAANEFPVPADFDGDGKIDRITWNPKTGVWHIRRSSTGKKSTVQFGLPGDIPLAQDFLGDGKADLTVFRPLPIDQSGFRKTAFYVYQPSSPASPLVFPWGNWGSVPELLDVSGDAKTDLSVFESLLGTFHVRTSALVDFVNIVFPAFTLAAASQPLLIEAFISPTVAGDANRDRISDFAIVQTSNELKLWNFVTLDGMLSQIYYGFPDDIALTGDVEGDKLVQPIVVRQNGGFLDWYLRLASGESLLVPAFGLENDEPLIGDLDCDGKDDLALTRKTGNGLLTWYWRISGDNYQLTFPGAHGLPFGFEQAKAFVSDMDGNGCAELVVAQENAGEIEWHSFDPKTYQARGLYRWGLAGDTAFSPADFDGDGSGNPIVIRTLGDDRYAFVLLGSGAYQLYHLGSEGVITAGRFSGLKTAEFALYRNSSNVGADTAVVFRQDGSVENYSFPLSPGQGTVVAPFVLPSAQSSTPAELGCRETKLFFNPELYKPFSDAHPGHGVTLFDDSILDGFEAWELYDKDNNFLGNELRFNCCHNGGRAHFWLPLRSTELAEIAPLTVRVVFTDGSSTCRTIPDPTKRYE